MQVGSVIVSPNPFSKQVVFDLRQLPASIQYRVEVYDISGKGITALTLSGGQFLRWNAEHLFCGIYFFSVKEMNGRLVSQGKLVKINQ